MRCARIRKGGLRSLLKVLVGALKASLWACKWALAPHALPAPARACYRVQPVINSQAAFARDVL
jgi:hypothetical protein